MSLHHAFTLRTRSILARRNRDPRGDPSDVNVAPWDQVPQARNSNFGGDYKKRDCMTRGKDKGYEGCSIHVPPAIAMVFPDLYRSFHAFFRALVFQMSEADKVPPIKPTVTPEQLFTRIVLSDTGLDVADMNDPGNATEWRHKEWAQHQWQKKTSTSWDAPEKVVRAVKASLVQGSLPDCAQIDPAVLNETNATFRATVSSEFLKEAVAQEARVAVSLCNAALWDPVLYRWMRGEWHTLEVHVGKTNEPLLTGLGYDLLGDKGRAEALKTRLHAWRVLVRRECGDRAKNSPFPTKFLHANSIGGCPRQGTLPKPEQLDAFNVTEKGDSASDESAFEIAIEEGGARRGVSAAKNKTRPYEYSGRFARMQCGHGNHSVGVGEATNETKDVENARPSARAPPKPTTPPTDKASGKLRHPDDDFDGALVISPIQVAVAMGDAKIVADLLRWGAKATVNALPTQRRAVSRNTTEGAAAGSVILAGGGLPSDSAPKDADAASPFARADARLRKGVASVLKGKGGSLETDVGTLLLEETASHRRTKEVLSDATLQLSTAAKNKMFKESWLQCAYTRYEKGPLLNEARTIVSVFDGVTDGLATLGDYLDRQAREELQACSSVDNKFCVTSSARAELSVGIGFEPATRTLCDASLKGTAYTEVRLRHRTDFTVTGALEGGIFPRMHYTGIVMNQPTPVGFPGGFEPSIVVKAPMQPMRFELFPITHSPWNRAGKVIPAGMNFFMEYEIYNMYCPIALPPFMWVMQMLKAVWIGFDAFHDALKSLYEDIQGLLGDIFAKIKAFAEGAGKKMHQGAAWFANHVNDGIKAIFEGLNMGEMLEGVCVCVCVCITLSVDTLPLARCTLHTAPES